MSRYFCHPLGNKQFPRNSGTYFTYVGHGRGKIDFGVPIGTPLYAMCTGQIVGIGEWYSKIHSGGRGTTYCILKCDANSNALGIDFYIRYLHGTFDESLLGKVVNRGQKIGESNNYGDSSGPHLHLDFSLSQISFVELYGSVTPDKKTFIFNGNNYPIKTKIDWDLIKAWQNQSGYSDNEIGYCWLILASEMNYLTPSPQYDPNPTPSPVPSPSPNSSLKITQVEPVTKNSGMWYYYNGILSDRFMGCPCPQSQEDFQSNACTGLRMIIDAGQHEYGGWPFAAVSFAKLLRLTLIGNYGINRFSKGATTLQQWITNVCNNKWGFIGGLDINSGNGCYNWNWNSHKDLIQAYYYSMKYPDIYGINLHTGTQEFKNAIIQAVNFGPTMNGWVDYTWAAPPKYAVLFNPASNKDEGKSGTPRGGVYIMYRGYNEIGGVNPNLTWE